MQRGCVPSSILATIAVMETPQVTQVATAFRALLQRLGIDATDEEVTSVHYVAALEAIFGEQLSGVVRDASTRSQHTSNVSRVLEHLTTALQLDLSHISAEAVCAHDELSEINLMDFFLELAAVVSGAGAGRDHDLAADEDDIIDDVDDGIDDEDISAPRSSAAEPMQQAATRQEKGKAPMSTAAVSLAPEAVDAPATPQPSDSQALEQHSPEFAYRSGTFVHQLAEWTDHETKLDRQRSATTGSILSEIQRVKSMVREPSLARIHQLGPRSMSSASRSMTASGSARGRGTGTQSSASIARDKHVAEEWRRHDVAVHQMHAAEAEDAEDRHGEDARQAALLQAFKQFMETESENPPPRRSAGETSRKQQRGSERSSGRTKQTSAAQPPARNRAGVGSGSNSSNMHGRRRRTTAAAAAAATHRSSTVSIADLGAIGAFQGLPKHVRRFVNTKVLELQKQAAQRKARRVSTRRERTHVEQQLLQYYSILQQYLVDKSRREQEAARRQKHSIQSAAHSSRQTRAYLRNFQAEQERHRKSREMKRKHREEQLYMALFKRLVAIERERMREEEAFEREQQRKSKEQQLARYTSIETHFRDQLAMMKDQMASERSARNTAYKDQKRMLRELEQDLRVKMQSQLAIVRDQIRQEDDLFYTRHMPPEALALHELPV